MPTYISGAQTVTSFIAPSTVEDTFPTHKPAYGLGGIRTVGSTAEMESISVDRREVGMIVYVSGLTAYYALIGTTANSGWTTGFTFGFVGGSGIGGDYVSTFNGSTGSVQGVSFAAAGAGIFLNAATGAITITNVGVQSFNGLTGAVQGVSSWNGQTGAVTFVNFVSSFNGKTGSVFGASLGANTFTELNTFNGGLITTGLTVGAGLTVSGNMSVSGNLTVSGGVTFTISENVLIEDNIITLNSNVTGTPTENSGIEIERGTSPNVYLLWNESSDRWTFTNNGTQYYDIPTDYVGSFNGLTGSLQGVSAAVAGTGIFVSGATGSVTITNVGVQSFNGLTGAVQGVSSWNGQTGAVTFVDYVSGFNGRTGAVQGVSAAAAGTGIFLNAATGSVTITNTGVLSFNGNTGNVQGVSSWNGQTGAVTFTDYVTSFNGLTGSVGGVTTSVANTFVPLQSFLGGISAAGATLNGNIISGNGIIRAASTSTGIFLFDTSTGITIGNNGGGNSGTLSLRPNTITVGPSTGNPAYIRTNTGITLELRPRHNLVLAPTPNTPLAASASSITLPISSSETLFSGGIYSYFSYSDGDEITDNPRLRLWSDQTKAGASYLDVSMDTPTANREIKFPNLSGTVALTNQVIGTVNGSTAATTAVTSFNGLTGAVQGVSAAVAGAGIFLNAATGSVTITNVGVQSFNGLTGAVQGVSSWNGQTGAVTFTDYVTSFNGVTGAVGGVTTSVANTFTALQSFNSGISAAGATLSANTRIPAGATLTVDGNIVANGNVSLGNATSDTITSAADITVNSLTVGRGGGGVSSNTAVGVSALVSNSTGSLNTAIGSTALTANTTGSSNVAVGDGALNANTTGSFNTAFGRHSLLSNNGSSNTAAGNGSLSNLSAGSFNTAIGRLTGSGVITATGGIYIGYSNLGTDSSTNEIVIGTQTTGFGSNTAVIGANTQTAAYIYGLVNAMGGVSAAGATFSNINIRSTGRIQAGTSETLYLGAAGGTEIEVNNDESAIRLWANGTQAIECFDTSTSVYTDFFASSTSSFSGMMTVYAGISAAGGVTFANNVQAAKIEADSVYSSTTNLALFNMGIV